jgi:uroporphyrinogen III methyltransferase/synthase
MQRGIVSFVALGPGDPSLRTVRAAERIARADVVVEDGRETPVARWIDLARQGKRVVRAMAGDVLESPGAIEEVLEVARAGIAFEVVPGVGGPAAAAAFAGVVGRAIHVKTGEVARIVEGEPPEAKVTLIACAGGPRQRVIETTAGRAADQANALGEQVVIVAFESPQEILRWFERRPLFGKRVLVTRAARQAAGTAELLRDQGAEPIVVPTISIHPPADPAPLARALADLRASRYAWVAFTSANGVERAWEALVAAGGDARAFGGARLAAIGPATARSLEDHGLHADVVAKEFRGEGLADEMLRSFRDCPPPDGVAGRNGGSPRILLARAAVARDALPIALRAAGCVVDVVAAYETRLASREAADSLVNELKAGRIDAVTFTSSSTVDNLCDLLGNHQAAELLSPVRIASIGPVTTEAARARGLRVDVTASRYTVPELVLALADSWAS